MSGSWSFIKTSKSAFLLTKIKLFRMAGLRAVSWSVYICRFLCVWIRHLARGVLIEFSVSKITLQKNLAVITNAELISMKISKSPLLYICSFSCMTTTFWSPTNSRTWLINGQRRKTVSVDMCSSLIVRTVPGVLQIALFSPNIGGWGPNRQEHTMI